MGARLRLKGKDWYIVVCDKGKRRSMKVGRDKRKAEDVRRYIQAELDLGKFQVKKVPPFKEYAHKWLDYIKQLRRPSTHERYKAILEKYVYPVIGSRPLDRLTRGDFRDILLSLHDQGLSRSSICIVRDLLSGTMGYAVDEELIPSNPVSGITKKLNLNRDKKPEIQPMTREEVELFLDNCEADLYPFFLCAFRTGMRLGELLALQWGDIDFNGRFIEVRRSYKRGMTTPTKTGKTRRVDMSDQLTRALRMLHKQRSRETLRGKAEGTRRNRFPSKREAHGAELHPSAV